MAHIFIKGMTPLIVGIALFITGSPCRAQSPELLQSGLMITPAPEYSAPGGVTTRGLERETGWDLLPREVSLSYPTQTRNIQDKVIDTNTYIIGPGDIFVLYLWGELDKSYMLRVTPEGYLIIPTMGTIKAADITIKAVGDSVRTLIVKLYKGMDSSLFLYEMRRFRLHVSGIVYIPGMHVSSAVERVSDVIERAGLILPGRRRKESEEGTSGVSTPKWERESKAAAGGVTSQEGPEVNFVNILTNTPGLTRAPEDLFTLGEKRGSSSRLITIHRGGRKLTADLLRFIKLGDLDTNPYVNSGDRIEVPPYNGDITIYGEVNDQGIYEYKSGDRVCDLVGFGGGLTSVADTTSARLVRFAPDGQSFEELMIDLHDALYMNPDAPLYVLKESDRLYVRKKYNYKVLADVMIYGEVKYPGQYAIAKNATTLSEIVRMAGGFTGDENLEEARLVREGNFAMVDQEYERINEIEPIERTREESDYINSYRRTFEGTVNANFVKLFRANDTTYDIVLQNGDIVYIPMKSAFVNVMGAVNEPGFVQVQDGVALDYYIEKSGGYKWDASKNKTRIYKARSSQRFKPGYKTMIEAGDTIHVPEKGRRTFWSYLREYSGYVSFITTIYFLGRG